MYGMNHEVLTGKQIRQFSRDVFSYIIFPETENNRQKGKVNFMKTGRKKVTRVIAVLLAFVMLLPFAHVECAKAAAKKNVVILYFSATGTTKSAAKRIKKATKGKLIEIKAKEPYTEDDLDYSDSDSRVTKEHESAASPAVSSVRPGISNLGAIKKAVKKADVVYIGYPIWWGEAPHIVYSLVESVSLRGKTVVPFCTSISSGIGDSAKNLQGNAKTSSETKWLSGRGFYDVPSQKTVNEWVKGLKY